MNLINNMMTDWLRQSFRRGLAFCGKRNYYEIFGYPINPDIRDYRDIYQRGDIAARIVEAYPGACWAEPPICVDDADTQDVTPWEKSVEDLFKSLDFWQNIKRLDTIAQLGKYAVLFIGFSGTAANAVSTQVPKGSRPVFLIPLAEDCAQIKSYVTNVNDPRFGKPLIYTLTVKGETLNSTRTIDVHYSRLIHVADRAVEDPLYGSSILERIFNRLLDLEKVVGSSAEMWWLNGRGGLTIETQTGNTGVNDLAGLKQSAEDYANQVKRIIATEGMTVKAINHTIADPKGNFEILLSVISGAVAIPQRILIGSERGELASSQDDDNWNDRVDERRKNFCTDNILDVFMQLMYDVGAIAKPKDGHAWEWPKPKISDAKKADISLKKTQALVAYANSPEADSVITPQQFVEELLNMEYREDEINDLLEAERDEMDKDIEAGIDPNTRLPLPPPMPKTTPFSKAS